MGLLSRMPPAAGNMAHNWNMFRGIDPSLAAYGQTQNGQMPSMPQATTDAAAAAYGGQAPQDMSASAMLGLGQSMMQQSQPQFRAPPPPQFLDPYRFRRGGR